MSFSVSSISIQFASWTKRPRVFFIALDPAGAADVCRVEVKRLRIKLDVKMIKKKRKQKNIRREMKKRLKSFT